MQPITLIRIACESFLCSLYFFVYCAVIYRIIFKQGCTNSLREAAQVTEQCMVAPNVSELCFM